jgi:hypothetical protein
MDLFLVTRMDNARFEQFSAFVIAANSHNGAIDVVTKSEWREPEPNWTHSFFEECEDDDGMEIPECPHPALDYGEWIAERIGVASQSIIEVKVLCASYHAG